MATRRKALVTLVAGSASAALAQRVTDRVVDHREHEHEASSDTQPSKPQQTPSFFEGRDYKTLVRLTDLIIPRTDTPGASDVGVPWRIDQAVSRKPELQPLYRQGLAYLNSAAQKNGKSEFLALPEDGQIAVLTSLSKSEAGPERDFFESAKALTIEWYYNSQEGLVQELGFKGNTFRTEFTGCTHPEHWPQQKS
jgi:hypothetical protein